jgi:hypothetical protein
LEGVPDQLCGILGGDGEWERHAVGIVGRIGKAIRHQKDRHDSSSHMTQVSKNWLYIRLYGDIALWVEADCAETLQQMMEEKPAIHTGPVFVKIERQFINVNSIIAFLTPDVLEARTRWQNRQWQREYQKWHEKGDEGRNEHYWCKNDAEKHHG